MTTDFEKLGAFYLGREYDLAAGKPGSELVLYDSKDLVTHAVCVGMTGSGKTGLCISILEEAAIDGIPAIVIDPKGDLSNLLLTFPQLQPSDFATWINEDDARRKGVEPAAYAAEQADKWREGLAQWGEEGDRIQRLRDAAEFVIYTPGSNAGLPVSLIKSFAAPPAELVSDSELLQERIASTVTSLLGVLGLNADPLQSREHILLSTIFQHVWTQGQNLDLSGLIESIQSPPVQRFGVMELEPFYPAKDRFALAMQLNNLIASPGFSRWMEGEPLDIGALLHTPAGKPRVAIFSIAHLNDAERMFFVSLLLNQTLAWVRTQSGTTSLRAILYMDEIAGYFPPVANPPSKGPLLTLMKQARAFGLGVMLATQNPVDLDYKGLANAGTWFIGRLQTERDKARVLDGLEGASATAAGKFDRQEIERLISQLGERVFLMNNVHEDAPVIFQVRWAMSYLRGPLTRNQIKTLMDPIREKKAASPVPIANETATPSAKPVTIRESSVSSSPPVLPPGIRQHYLPIRSGDGGDIIYKPMLFGSARVYYSDTKAGVDQEKHIAYLIPLTSGPTIVDWEAAQPSELAETDLDSEPSPGASFTSLPPEASREKSYETWKKNWLGLIYREDKLELLRSPSTELTSKPGESEREFRLRLVQAAREKRDALVEQLRAKYAPKVAVLEDRLRRAEQARAVQQQQSTAAKMSTVVSFGTAVLSAVLGRKTISAGSISRAGTAVRGAQRSVKESGDVARAGENVEAIRNQLTDLDVKLQEELAATASQFDTSQETLDTISIKPKKTNITLSSLVLAWAPSHAQ